uniref:Uncharacterized protein n=1 Tax=Opuntia streptacantha TaxID=393608 RepID=A0A7C8ZI15_OPUST
MPFLEPKPPDPSHPASYFLSWHLPCSSLLKFCFASIVSPESSMDARSGSSKYGSDVVPEPWCSLACLWVSQLDSATGSANLDVKFVNLGLFFVLKYSFLDGHESAPSCTGSSLSRFIHVPGDVRLQCQVWVCAFSFSSAPPSSGMSLFCGGHDLFLSVLGMSLSFCCLPLLLTSVSHVFVHYEF